MYINIDGITHEIQKQMIMYHYISCISYILFQILTIFCAHNRLKTLKELASKHRSIAHKKTEEVRYRHPHVASKNSHDICTSMQYEVNTDVDDSTFNIH